MTEARALARELSRAVGGEVRFGAESRALYANDASVYRQVPIGVVIPRDVSDVIATVAACREQIAHGTGRRALHLAQLLAQAARDGQPPGQLPADRPAAGNDGTGKHGRPAARLAAAAAGAGLAAGTAIAIRSLRGGSHG